MRNTWKARDVADGCQDCGLELTPTVFIVMKMENVQSGLPR